MPTWTATMNDTTRTGTARTPAAAWAQVHLAAAELVSADVLDVLYLDVEGQRATIRPAESGNTDADRAATLALIADGARAVIAAHCHVPACRSRPATRASNREPKTRRTTLPSSFATPVRSRLQPR
jgi:hypothetical protein